MDCHNCRTAEMIAAGEYRSTPWKKIPCSKCEAVAEPTHHGRTHLPYDEALGGGSGRKNGIGRNVDAPLLEADRRKTVPATPWAQYESDHPIFDGKVVQADPREPSVAAMAYIAKAFLALNPITREIVLSRLADPFAPLRLIADRVGLPVQRVHDRLKKARQEWPALAYAIRMNERPEKPQDAPAGGSSGLCQKKKGGRPCRS